MNTRFKVFASYNILQCLCDFIHVLIFVIISKCQKKSQINEYSDLDEWLFSRLNNQQEETRWIAWVWTQVGGWLANRTISGNYGWYHLPLWMKTVTSSDNPSWMSNRWCLPLWWSLSTLHITMTAVGSKQNDRRWVSTLCFFVCCIAKWQRLYDTIRALALRTFVRSSAVSITQF